MTPMSDLFATDQPMQNLVEELTTTVTAAVRKVFPKLVAAELMKLSSGATNGASVTKVEQIIALKTKGMRNADIARSVGTHQSYVANVLTRSKTRPTAGAESHKGKYGAALAKHGTHKKAATSLGMARSTFSEHLAAEKAA